MDYKYISVGEKLKRSLKLKQFVSVVSVVSASRSGCVWSSAAAVVCDIGGGVPVNPNIDETTSVAVYPSQIRDTSPT